MAPEMGVFIAATGSNAGKTSAAIGMIAALRSMGLTVQAAKAGPDFLDAAWLEMASGRPCPNLDMFMGANGAWRKCWERFLNNSDFAVIEGSMGLFDGDAGGLSSGSLLARMLDLPVLLLLNARGVGQSVAAIAKGFFQYLPPNMFGSLRFCGVICTHVASERHWRLLSRALHPVCSDANVPLLGYLSVQGAPQLESRHLGLKQACECDLDLAAAKQWFGSHVNVESLRKCCACGRMNTVRDEYPEADVVVAIARDEAFAFCYADLPLLLAEFGAKAVFFSPLRDRELPRCDAIYIPGGYPELYGAQLAANETMKVSLRKAACMGKPVYGECGGYMYLMEAIVDADGRLWPMSGLLPGMARMGRRLAALGYRVVQGGDLTGKVYGHEFHYARGPEVPGDLWNVSDAEGRPVASSCVNVGSVTGSWIHLYPEGSRSFWQRWLEVARRRKKQAGALCP